MSFDGKAPASRSSFARLSIVTSTAAACCLLSAVATATTLEPAPQLSPPDAEYFGAAVAIHGELLAVGDTGRESVRIFRRDGLAPAGWSQIAELVDWHQDHSAEGASLGFADAQTLLIGSAGPEGRIDLAEAAADGWSIVGQLPIGGSRGQLGRELAVDDGWAATVAGNLDGSNRELLIYRRAGASWDLEATVPVATPVTGSIARPQSIELDSGVLALGQSGSASIAGRVLIFELGSVGASAPDWKQIAELVSEADDPDHRASFGWAVALAPDRLAVGAPWSDLGPVNGAVELFVRHPADPGPGEPGWLPSQTIVAPAEGPPIAAPGFGTDVVFLSPDRLAVVAPAEGVSIGLPGCHCRASRLHLFERQAGELVETARWTGPREGDIADDLPSWPDEITGPLVAEGNLIVAGATPASVAPFEADAATPHLLAGRFEVETSWQTATASGSGRLMSFGDQPATTDRSAFFWFFHPDSLELAVKMVDGCVVNGYRWLFVSAFTNQAFEVLVRDRETGEEQIVSNPLGELPRTHADTAAFACE